MPLSNSCTERRGRRCTRPTRPARLGDEAGSASLEFLTAGLILLVPLVYLVLALAAVQGGVFAVEGAARHAARVAVDVAASPGRDAEVERAIRTVLDDYGVARGEANVEVRCRPADCVAAGTRITVTVSARVPLPMMPDAVAHWSAASVPVSGTATQTVSRFAAVPR